jgi:hypothetical protein
MCGLMCLAFALTQNLVSAKFLTVVHQYISYCDIVDSILAPVILDGAQRTDKI